VIPHLVWNHSTQHPKWHLDWFSRFCRAHYRNKQTDHTSLSVAIGRIYTGLWTIQSNISVRHYTCVALWLHQKGPFWAASLTSGSSMPNEDRSLQTFWIQVERGLPGVFSSYLAVAQTEFDWRQPTHSLERRVQTNRVDGTLKRRKVEDAKLFDVLHNSWQSTAMRPNNTNNGTQYYEQTVWKADFSWAICLLLMDHTKVNGGTTPASENGVSVSPAPAAYSGI